MPEDPVLLEWHADTGWVDLVTLRGPQTRMVAWVKGALSADLDPGPSVGVSVTHEAFCVVCGKSFQAQRRSAKYCSPAHRERARRERQR